MNKDIDFYECKKPSVAHKRDSLGCLVNSDVVDSFTPAHFASGWVLGRLGFHPAIIFALGMAWDWSWERKMKCEYAHLFPYASQDEMTHVAADLVAYGVGAYIGRKAHLERRGL